jgi:hypothetical protein
VVKGDPAPPSMLGLPAKGAGFEPACTLGRAFLPYRHVRLLWALV